MLNSYYWKFYVLFELSWNFVGPSSKSVDNEYTTIFHFSTHGIKIIDMFSDFRKTCFLILEKL